MTTHVDFTLASGGSASIQFTASPLPMSVKITRTSGEAIAQFAPGGESGPVALPGGALRVTAFYEMNGQWIPIDVDLNEDTSSRARFRCSAYVGSTITPTGGGGSTKLEAFVTVDKQ